MKKHQLWRPYLLIAIISLIIVMPQILNHADIIGVDSIFHMNRFYDTAMQIKTGHFNYFQSFFGFSSSGRIVNPLYGANFAYLNGLLLLLTHNWINFQILNSFLILLISGSTMYHLSRKFSVSQRGSLIVGLIYMFSTPILVWLVGQQFTGWGAAILPLVFMSCSGLINGKVDYISLAFGIVIIFQVHMLSALIGSLAILPFWISGFHKFADKRRSMLINTGKAFLWFVVLSANVWGGMLEVMTSNHLLSVAPATPLSEDALRLFGNASPDTLNVLDSIMFALILLYVVFFWKNLKRDFRIVSLTGLGFLIISSNLIPWKVIGQIFPGLNYYLQMPKRLDVVAFILLALSVGMIMRDRTPFPDFERLKPWIAGIFILGSLTTTYLTINDGIQNGWKSNEAVQNDYNVDFHITSGTQLRHDLNSANLSLALKDITKSTPDYLPVKHYLKPDQYFPFHPYHAYGSQIVRNQFNLRPSQNNVKKWVNNDGLHISWNNNSISYKRTAIPIIKYAHTHVMLNGSTINHPKTSQIGVVNVNAKPGKNELVVRYVPSWWFKLLMLIANVSWVVLLIIFIRKRKNVD